VTLDGITKDDFHAWKHHPVSKLYLRYLGDYRAMLLRELLARWEAGALTLDTEKEIRGRTMTLADLVDLQFASIEKFYSEEENETTVAQIVPEA
jgi:hypothetical protein